MLWLIGGIILFYIIYCLAFVLFQRYFIFRPKRLSANHKFQPDIPYIELNIEAGDHANLHGLLLHPSASKGIVIYFHGNWHNLDNYLPFTRKFTDYGYSVLITDYRSYGKSTGKITEENIYSDSVVWYSVALNYFPPEKIIIYGRSLGTAPATYLATLYSCKQLILETPFSSMYDIARRHGMLFPDGNYLTFSLRTDIILKSVKVPVMILHGTKDETVSIQSGRKLKKSLKQGDLFVEIKKGKHKNLHLFEDYHRAIDSIFTTKI